ncbi:MAG TPA: ribonuclease R [Steroidobacteraceae bacterium]|nr:ribonuclease R [Steroidobacteraceae bacterium]
MSTRGGQFGRRRSHGPPKAIASGAHGTKDRHGGAQGHGASRHRAGDSVEGTVSAHRAGYGFVRVEGLKDSVFLPPGQMRGVMHGDRVRVRLSRDASNRWLGEVEEVLERGVKAFLGTVEIQGRQVAIIAADRRLQLRCVASLNELEGARDGDWVIAHIVRHASATSPPVARVARRLDPERPVEMATESAIARFDLPSDFPREVSAEADAFGTEVDPEESARRIDLRGLPLVTIDGETARDFDDAVYAEPHAEGFRLIVAIADVSFYVRQGTALDGEALRRGTSVYFPTRVIPMLPPGLSDHLCSLAPHVDRLCLTADMIITRHGALKSARFYPAVMRSAARLTYTQAQEALLDGRPEARARLGALVDRLMPLVDVYRVLAKARRARGALDFDAPEADFAIDASERIHAVTLHARVEAHKLIEECMVLANVAVARELGHTRTPTLYRVHGKPEAEKLDKLLATLAVLGIEAQIPQDVTPRDIQAITRRLKGSAELPFVESLVVRSMPQAVYQPTNIGHFGMALAEYGHFTSPIRRYPDLVVHRTLKALVSAQDGSGVEYEAEALSRQGEELSRLEKRADESDRYVSAFLKCVWLRERTGQTFRGLITTVVEFGCFVQLMDVAIDGLLHLDNLRDDEYRMADHGHAWRAVRSGRDLRIGTEVRVIVTAVNPIEGLIDLDLVPEPGAADAPVKESREGNGGKGGRTTRGAKDARHSRPHHGRR